MRKSSYLKVIFIFEDVFLFEIVIIFEVVAIFKVVIMFVVVFIFDIFFIFRFIRFKKHLVPLIVAAKASLKLYLKPIQDWVV